MVIEYLVLVAVVAFFQKGPEELSPVAQTIIKALLPLLVWLSLYVSDRRPFFMARGKPVYDAETSREQVELLWSASSIDGEYASITR